MSGRSGYRKTDAKRPRNMFARPKPRDEYVLRFQLPRLLAGLISPGIHGYGVTIGYNDIAFVSGQSPAHCAQLASDFLDKIGARSHPQVIIPASVIKLLPCPAHHLPANKDECFNPIGLDLEAVHDRISRNTDRARSAAIAIEADAITITGATRKPLVFDFTDTAASCFRSA